MSFDVNPYSVGSFMAAALLIPLSWLVYRARQERAENRRLALFLFVQGATGVAIGAIYGAATPAGAYAASVVAWPAVLAAITTYLRFVETFDVPPARPIRTRARQMAPVGAAGGAA